MYLQLEPFLRQSVSSNSESSSVAPDSSSNSAPSPPYQLQVITLLGKKFNLTLTNQLDQTTASQLKALIYEREGIHPDQQWLLYGG